MTELARLSDQQLMEQVCSGQSEPFAELVRRYRPALLRVAESRLGERHRAEDVVQETLLAVLRASGSYQPTRSFRTWLWTILLNECREAWSKEHRQATLVTKAAAEPPAQTGEAEPLHHLLASERAEQLHQFLAAMHPNQADALRLRFFAGLKFQEIADCMGCALATAKHRVRWGLLNLSALARNTFTDRTDSKASRGHSSSRDRLP